MYLTYLVNQHERKKKKRYLLLHLWVLVLEVLWMIISVSMLKSVLHGEKGCLVVGGGGIAGSRRKSLPLIVRKVAA